MTTSRSVLPPNDWIAYYDWRTGEVLHVDAFHNPQRSAVRRDMPRGYEAWEMK